MSRARPGGIALAHVSGLHAYAPGLQPSEPGWVKLNTNECPYPPSPRVAEAVLREVGGDGKALRLYPDPASRALRGAVARLHGVEGAGVCIGNGSDDILNLLVRCFCGSTSLDRRRIHDRKIVDDLDLAVPPRPRPSRCRATPFTRS